MTFKNMKIPVENNLDEIVVELEKRGYKNISARPFKNNDLVVCFDDGEFFFAAPWAERIKTTTLAELKEM